MTAPDVYTFPGHAVLLERPDGSATVLGAFPTAEVAEGFAEVEREFWDVTWVVSVKSAKVRLEVER